MDEAAKCNEATSFRQKDATQRTSRSLDQHDPLDDLNAMHRERARTPSFYGTSAYPSSAAGSTLASSIAARFWLFKTPATLARHGALGSSSFGSVEEHVEFGSSRVCKVSFSSKYTTKATIAFAVAAHRYQMPYR